MAFAKRVFMIARFSLYHIPYSGYDVIYFRDNGLIVGRLHVSDTSEK